MIYPYMTSKTVLRDVIALHCHLEVTSVCRLGMKSKMMKLCKVAFECYDTTKQAKSERHLKFAFVAESQTFFLTQEPNCLICCFGSLY